MSMEGGTMKTLIMTVTDSGIYARYNETISSLGVWLGRDWSDVVVFNVVSLCAYPIRIRWE